MKRILFALFTICTFVTCKKESIETFDPNNGVSLSFATGNGSTSDSVSYTFALKDSTLLKDTIYVRLVLSGQPYKEDKPFTLKINPESTAKENVHFQLTEKVWPANETRWNYPIVVLKTADMKEQVYDLIIDNEQNENFYIGPTGSATQYSSSGLPSKITYYNQYKIKISNKLVMPDWWDAGISWYFGDYSETRYRFMIQVTGLTDFRLNTDGGSLTSGGISNIQQQLRKAVNEYNNTHTTPLTDEFDQLISF